MPNDNLSEKELFELYKGKAKDKISKLGGLPKVFAESYLDKFFLEYEKRYLSGPVKPEERAAKYKQTAKALFKLNEELDKELLVE